MAANLDAQTLQQILAMLQGQGATNNGATQWTGAEGSPLESYSIDRRQGPGQYNGTDQYTPGDLQTLIYGPQSGGTWGTQSNDVWDTQGNYLGTSSGDSTALGLAKFIAMSLGGYYGAQGLDGALAGGAAEGAGAGLSGWDAAMADAAASGSISGTAGGLGTIGAGTAAAGAGGGLTGSSLASGAKTAVDALDGGKGVAALLGGVAGALDSGDKEQTSSRDPWSAAQPALRGLLSEGTDIYNQYKARPFSQSQAAGYTNQGGLLDLLNQNAGGLLSGFQANASGANQFSRNNPRRGLIGSNFNPTAEQWQPVGYGDMGMTQFRGR